MSFWNTLKQKLRSFIDVYKRQPYGLPEAIAILFIVFLHKWKKNTLLSIGGGTILYMLGQRQSRPGAETNLFEPCRDAACLSGGLSAAKIM